MTEEQEKAMYSVVDEYKNICALLKIPYNAKDLEDTSKRIFNKALEVKNENDELKKYVEVMSKISSDTDYETIAQLVGDAYPKIQSI